jgi:hypothetical protein
MKKTLLLLSVTFFSKLLLAQQPAPLIWGVTPQSDDLYSTDTTLWTTGTSIQPVITNSVIDGMTGLAYDPTTYKSYVIAKVNGNRYLAQINLATGNCTVMGNLGDNFSSICFDEFGLLWGATGDGASISEGLFVINKATASNTLVFQMGNGADGEVICYNRFDNKMYHWSGNGTLVYESWPITNLTYAPTNITTSGSISNETFGALNLTANRFIVATISDEYQHLTTSGFYTTPSSSNPDGFRGVIMPPRFAVSPSTVCAKSGTVGLYSNCLQLYDSVYYYWGDGNISQLLASSSSTAPAIHTYTNSGTFTISVSLYNGSVPKSTIQTFTVLVNTTPSVTVTGGGNLCPGQTLTLTATGGGTSQWLQNNVNIPAANQTTYVVTAPGWYNMRKTNLSGCSDTAAVGVLVNALAGPTITASSGTICVGLNYGFILNGANTYTITNGTSVVPPVVGPTVTTTYSVVGTSTSGCNSAAPVVATVVVGYPPTLTVTSSNATICSGQSATLTAIGAPTISWAGTSGSPSQTLVVSPTTNSTYIVAGNGSVACSSTVSITQVVTDCTGIPEGTVAPPVRVMPNPTNGKITIQNLNDLAQVEIFNALGQRITFNVATSPEISVDLSSYSSGVYFVKVTQQNKLQAVIKVIKE